MEQLQCCHIARNVIRYIPKVICQTKLLQMTFASQRSTMKGVLEFVFANLWTLINIIFPYILIFIVLFTYLLFHPFTIHHECVVDRGINIAEF